MKDAPTRVFWLMCVLVAVWTATYWLYEPAEPPVTFDQTTSKDAGSKGSKNGGTGPMAELSPPLKHGPDGEARTGGNLKPSESVGSKPSSKPRDESPKTRVIPPEFSEYVVQPGDTLAVIAKRTLGDSKYANKIAEANPLLDARKLIPGRTKLRIPKDVSNIQGKEVVIDPMAGKTFPTPVKETPAKEAPKVEPTPATPVEASTEASGVEYTVQAEDTLSSIAKTVYGKSSMWRKIYEANKGVIADPDHLKPGTKIRIPAQ